MTDINFIDGVLLNKKKYDLAVIQGKTYQRIFTYSEDLTAGTLFGQIRNGYAQDGGVLLAEFNFQAMTYDALTLKTTIIAELTATVTALVPYTKYQGGDTIPSTRNCWVYDIEHREGDIVKLISRGLVQVKPEVTISS